ncbi:MAG: GntR family transcriptional regulator [Gordonia sp. (in: high G+C Gram-positive bacteria)]
MELNAVSRRSATDEVHDQLLRQLISGDAPPGTRLPSERSLAEALGVSRPVVREALARLAASGHVDVRQGDGTVVNDLTRTGGLDLLPHLLINAPDGAMVDPAVVRSVLEIRAYLGPWIAEQAAARSAPSLAESLPEALGAVVDAPTGPQQQAAALAFWDQLVRGADSIAMTLIFNGMRRVYEPMLGLVADAAAAAEPAERYRALADAVMAGRPAAARAAAEELLAGITEVFGGLLDQMEGS